MNPALRNMLVAVGVFTLGGVAVSVFTPQPATRSMADLKDAGILLGQPIVVECPERLTKQTKRRVNAVQPGQLRPSQSYAHLARTARCFGDKLLDGGFGNCLRADGGSLAPFVEEFQEWRYNDPGDGGNVWLRTTGMPMALSDGGTSDGVALDDGGMLLIDHRNDGGLFGRVVGDPRTLELVIPSLRLNLSGVDLDASVGIDDGGDSSDVDDSFQYRTDACDWYHCSQYDDMVDAGLRPNPFANRFCGALNRLMLVPSPCMIPDGRLPDGGWLDDAPPGQIDCRFGGPYGETDGGPRWRGVNVGPAAYAVGTQCLPVECSVVAGDVPSQWL